MTEAENPARLLPKFATGQKTERLSSAISLSMRPVLTQPTALHTSLSILRI